jgi:hypothetical protein
MIVNKLYEKILADKELNYMYKNSDLNKIKEHMI